jgi:hypothetical protein
VLPFAIHQSTGEQTMKQSTLATEMRYCADIGMWAIDRPISSSCVHRTTFCDANCYNHKLYAMYGAMHGKDTRNEIAWTANAVEGLGKTLARKRKGSKSRARLMTRGEAFSDHADIARVEAILQATPETVWWIPTRAWRNALLWSRVEDLAARYSNVRVLASLDPSNSAEDWAGLDAASIMFFGDDAVASRPSNGERMFKCPKTHAHLSGHCAICKAGCFSSRRVSIHLKAH